MEKYTPVKSYELPILEALAELNGEGGSKDVISRVYYKTRGLLTLADVNSITGSEVAWRNRVRWAKSRLSKANLVVSEKKGRWKLTSKAVSLLKDLKGTR